MDEWIRRKQVKGLLRAVQKCFYNKNFELTQNFHINPGLQIAWVKMVIANYSLNQFKLNI